jgi:microcystin-dependent protein
VLGNTTTINSNVVTTNDLSVNFANNAINSSAANGGGIEVGPLGSPYITWLYNSTDNTWNTGGGISVAGNISSAGNITASNLTISGTTNFMPTGSLLMWPTAVAPTGFLICNGSAVSRSTYANLFAIVGTTFGSGNGSTTFNLPNYTDRMPIGTGTIAANVGDTGGSQTTTLSTSNLPAHTHTTSVTDPGHHHTSAGNGAPNGGGAGAAFTGDGPNPSGNQPGHTTLDSTTGISVSIGSTGSGTAATTISPFLGINFIIKV